MPMDKVDEQLIAALQRDGRRHVAVLAKDLGIPRSTAQERLRRLLEKGIIQRFVPVLDHGKLGNPASAFILATFQPGSGAQHRKAVRDIAKIAGLERVDMLTGEWDIMLHVRGASLEAIGDLVVDKLRTNPAIARTVTMASFHSVQTG